MGSRDLENLAAVVAIGGICLAVGILVYLDLSVPGWIVLGAAAALALVTAYALLSGMASLLRHEEQRDRALPPSGGPSSPR